MLSNHPNCLGGNGPSASSDLIGDVDGPASATDNAVARFDGTTGKLIQNSVVTIADTTGAIAGAQSLTAPAATPLTLAGGSSGASLVLGQGATASATITNTGTGSLSVVNSDFANTLILSRNTLVTNLGTAIKFRSKDDGDTYVDVGDFYAAKSSATAGAVSSFFTWGTRRAGTLTDAMTLTATGNLVIGPTTSETGLTGAGGLKISSTTAGASNAGALVVAGGISAGAASYFGGAVSGITTLAMSDNLTMSNSDARILSGTSTGRGIFANSNVSAYIIAYGATHATTPGHIVTVAAAGAAQTTLSSTGLAITGALSTTGAATFAGAVTIGNTVNTVSPTSPNRTVTMVVNGVTLYLAAKTTND